MEAVQARARSAEAEAPPEVDLVERAPAGDYLGFVATVTFWMGITFETPASGAPSPSPSARADPLRRSSHDRADLGQQRPQVQRAVAAAVADRDRSAAGTEIHLAHPTPPETCVASGCESRPASSLSSGKNASERSFGTPLADHIDG